MAFLIGDMQITYVEQKEYDGRKYFKMQAVGKDKAVYSLSAPYEDQPKAGDIYQLYIEPDRYFKPKVRAQKVR